jgi:hypothetical protein
VVSPDRWAKDALVVALDQQRRARGLLLQRVAHLLGTLDRLAVHRPHHIARLDPGAFRGSGHVLGRSIRASSTALSPIMRSSSTSSSRTGTLEREESRQYAAGALGDD